MKKTIIFFKLLFFISIIIYLLSVPVRIMHIDTLYVHMYQSRVHSIAIVRYFEVLGANAMKLISKQAMAIE